jgi:uncharacterized protein
MLDIFQSFFHTGSILLVPFSALIFAIMIKGIVHAAKGRFTVSSMLGSGGMPSAHSTFVIALATAMGIKNGVWSDEFAVCLVFSIIIIYDAMNVRYQSGLHARALNHLAPHDGETLNESIGHTPIEAFAGGVIGFMTAVLLLGV